MNYLRIHQYAFTPQYVFDGCEYEAPLRFDFYLHGLNMVIEYDGEGHYRPIDFAGKGELWANKEFQKVKIRDSIKDRFCKEHNIELIRIPYWDYDAIEEILSHNLQSRITSLRQAV